MNKKFMSFVLAMVLSAGLGVSAFAITAEYDSRAAYVTANSRSYSWESVASNSTADNLDGTTSTTLTGNGNMILFGSAKDRLSGNLSGLFSYYGGMLIGYQQAGGTYQIYDSYGVRGVMASSVGSEHFSMQSWTFRPGEDPFSGCETVEDYENVYRTIGWSEESLRRMKFDEQGNPVGTVYTGMKITTSGAKKEVDEKEYKEEQDSDYYYFTETKGTGDEEKTVYYKVKKSDTREAKAGEEADFTNVSIDKDGIEYQSETLDFYRAIRDTLNNGQNYSVTVSLGSGAQGLSFTVAKDGTVVGTYVAYDHSANETSPLGETELFGKSYSGIRCTSQALIDKETGLQYGTREYTWAADGTTANNKETQVGVRGHWAAKDTYINYDDTTGNRYDTTFNEVSLENDEIVRSEEHYNLSDPSVRGDKTLASSVMYYSENGSRSEQYNNEKNERTYFADNLVSVTYNSHDTAIYKVKFTDNHVQEAIWASDNTEDQAGDGDMGGTYQVCDYNGTVVAAYDDPNGKIFGGGHSDHQAMLNIANEYKQNLINGRNVGTVSGLKTVNWYEKELKQIASMPNRSATINKIWDSSGITTALNFSNGINTVGSTAIADSTWNEDNFPEDAVMGDGVTETVSSTEEVDGGTVIQGGSFPSYKRLKSSKTKVTGRGYSLTTTVMAGGSSVFQTKCDIVTQKYVKTTNTYETVKDPAVEGEVVTDKEKIAEIFGVDPDEVEIEDGVITIDGVSYLAVEAASINIMDGSGFQAADGEVVIVQLNGKDSNGKEINGLTNEEIAKLKSNIAKGDTKVIFMGNVSDNLNGNKAMTIETGYDGGFAIGQDAVNAERDRIFLTSLGAAMQNGMDGALASATMDEYNKRYGTNYTTADSDKALANATADDQWIIDNTKTNMEVFHYSQKEYNEGWEVLRQLALNF